MEVLDELLGDHTSCRRLLTGASLNTILHQIAKAANIAKQSGDSKFVLAWGDRVLAVVQIFETSDSSGLNYSLIQAMVSSMQVRQKASISDSNTRAHAQHSQLISFVLLRQTPSWPKATPSGPSPKPRSGSNSRRVSLALDATFGAS